MVALSSLAIHTSTVSCARASLRLGVSPLPSRLRVRATDERRATIRRRQTFSRRPWLRGPEHETCSMLHAPAVRIKTRLKAGWNFCHILSSHLLLRYC